MLRAALCFALPLLSQTTPQPTFEVASIKINKTGGPSNSNFPLGPGNAYTPNGGRFSATGFPLVTYITFAYKLVGGQTQSFVSQLPEWATTDRYDIEARAEGNPGKDDMRMMMRALLAERFQLAVHEEERQFPVVALVPVKEGKLGPQIQPHPADTPCPTDAPPNGIAEDQRFPLLCGGLLPMPPSQPGRLRFGGRNVSLELVAKTLNAGTGSDRPLVDGTGLSGTFDFNLEWVQEQRGPVKPGVEEQLDRLGPTFEEALRTQLGFKLANQKSALKVMVLDKVERPTEN